MRTSRILLALLLLPISNCSCGTDDIRSVGEEETEEEIAHNTREDDTSEVSDDAQDGEVLNTDDDNTNPGDTTTVTGLICAGPDASNTGFPLRNARVELYAGNTLIETTQTDLNGSYTFSGLEPGSYSIRIEQGLFEWRSPVFELFAGQTYDISTDEGCVELEAPDMLVYTGSYDRIQDVLAYLGVSTYELASGFDYAGDDFLASLLEDDLSPYKAIFFNCGNELGYEDAWASGDDVFIAERLQDFVRNGGSLYFSDWASELMELAFPEAIDWVGNDNNPYEAHDGVPQTSDAFIVDDDFAALYGDDYAFVEFDTRGFSVIDALGENTEAIIDSPALATYDEEEPTPRHIVVRHRPYTNPTAGLVYFTSLHTENGTDLSSDNVMVGLMASVIFSL